MYTKGQKLKHLKSRWTKGFKCFYRVKKSKQTCFSERVSNQFTDQFIFWRPQQKNNISRQSISVLSQEAAGIIDHLITWEARCIYIQQAIIFTDELGLKRWKFKLCHHSRTLTYIKEDILRNVWVFFIHTPGQRHKLFCYQHLQNVSSFTFHRRKKAIQSWNG